ncbi:hypothetical protein [Maribacter spongiicola]|uniref:hypothetical protein n=1 Tax=Maribacter spongiicola TaxID=1206753 RepID=UPI003F9C5CCE
MDLQIVEKIEIIWNDIQLKVDQGELTISSEKTFVFYFAWNFNKLFENEEIKIDFEKDLFETFTDGKYIDLLIKVNTKENTDFRIGLEFKFPNKKKNSSGHTQVRQKIVNDLKRLDYLVQSNQIDLGIFLCATNENSFLINKVRRTAPDFLVHHEAEYLKSNFYPFNDSHQEQIKISSDIKFEWSAKRINSDLEFSFLKPIYFSANGSVATKTKVVDNNIPNENKIFSIKIIKTYFNSGFININKKASKILGDRGSTLTLEYKDIQLQIPINRTSIGLDSVRLYKGQEMIDLITENFELNEEIKFQVINPLFVRLEK